ncbi:lantibiotic dehydratase [Fluviispira vulneris]|uniref:lantibiotic dehydratase n=1 Tax=Fluviispira vulneris TaxID=2763012 RepID=UPI001645E629|nr:lantibiotic dehydratase [Fluviispira vulneris]
MILPAQFFLLRMPIFPVNFFLEYLKSYEDILIYLKNKPYYNIFKEAILLSSPSLYESLMLYESDKIHDLRKLTQIKSSLLKYFSRACTRSTPYGYFATVQMGYYSEEIRSFYQNENKYYKSIHPDMEWLQGFVRKIEEDIAFLADVKLKINPIIYQHGDRVLLPYSSIKTKEQNSDNKLQINEDVSIKNNSLVNFIQIVLKDETKLSYLVDKIKIKFQLNDDIKILNLLQDLINKSFIITELKPILGKSDVFSEFIDKLGQFPSQKQNYEYLINLKNEINKYAELNIGDGITQLEKILSKMKEYLRVSNYLQVDISAQNKKSFRLNNKMLSNLQDAANFMLMLSPKEFGFAHMREYYEEFLEKYGTYREISLKELMDENLGLGAPAEYKYPQSYRKIKKSKKSGEEKLVALLIDKIMLSQGNLVESIQITENDLNNLSLNKINLDGIPESAEIYAQIFDDNSLLADKIALSGIQWTFGACASFGRFTDLFSSAEKNDIRSYIKTIEEKNPDILYCEIVYSPHASRSGNVALTESYWGYQIYLDSFQNKHGSVLTLDDIFVCADAKRLYFKSNKYQKEVVFVASHVLNFQNAPNIVRFMRELSFENKVLWNFFQIGDLAKSTYIPRIEFKNVIISPRTWTLTIDSLKYHKENITIKDDFISAFKMWKNSWRIPRYIYCVHTDNKILLDINQDFHLQEIKRELLNNKKVILQEYLDIETAENKDEKFIFNKEIVFPLLRNEKRNSSFTISKSISNNNYPRLFFPGSEWYYCKLYFSKSREEEFIANYIHEFMLEIKNEINIESWFFIRYSDDKKHIRLRILLKDKLEYTKLSEKMNLFYTLCSKRGILNSVCVDSYEPEIERYGGPDLLPFAEKIFQYDSQLSCLILKNKKLIGEEFSLEYLCAFLSIELLDAFSLNYKEKLNWAESITNKDLYIDDFRDKRKRITNIFMENELKWYKNKEFNFLNEAIQFRSNAVESFKNIFEKIYDESNIYEARSSIIKSLVHMQCNRNLGINREREKKANAFILHTLYSLKFYLNKNN